MPKIEHEGRVYLLRWLPEHDETILLAASCFDGCKRVDWKFADEAGWLVGLPYVKLTCFARRLSRLKGTEKRYPNSAKRRGYGTTNAKVKVFNKVNSIGWNKKANSILLGIAEKYRTNGSHIDWPKVFCGDEILGIPEQYRDARVLTKRASLLLNPRPKRPRRPASPQSIARVVEINKAKVNAVNRILWDKIPVRQ